MASEPLRTPAEARMYMDGQQNAGGQRKIDDNGKPYFDPAPLSEYPRMLYRATETEVVQEGPNAIDGMKDKPIVINRFDGLLCDTVVADSLTDAETLAADGWEISPRAAHGLSTGIGSATSAKDEEIERLRAQVAALSATTHHEDEAPVDPPRRGPGRPRLTPAEG